MDAPAPVPDVQNAFASRRRLSDRIGDTALHVITGAAAFGAVAVLGLIVYRLIYGAWPSIEEFRIPFVWHQTWDPVTSQFGALNFLYGTAVTSFAAVLIAGPVAIAIALYLTELAPAAVRGIVGSLVEMLAAVPSVVLGLWGIFVLGPFVRDHFDPWLNNWFGWIPIFSGTPQQAGLMPAGTSLTTYPGTHEETQRLGQRLLDEHAELARDLAPGLEVSTLLVRGDLVGSLVRAADQVSLTVLGDERHPLLDRIATGSVLTGVAARAAGAVVAVPSGWDGSVCKEGVVAAVKSCTESAALVRRAMEIATVTIPANAPSPKNAALPVAPAAIPPRPRRATPASSPRTPPIAARTAIAAPATTGAFIVASPNRTLR